jgi:hypothetical protein
VISITVKKVTLTDSPTTEEWRNALIEYLPLIHNYGYTYTLNGNQLTVTDLTCNANNSIDDLLNEDKKSISTQKVLFKLWENQKNSDILKDLIETLRYGSS